MRSKRPWRKANRRNQEDGAIQNPRDQDIPLKNEDVRQLLHSIFDPERNTLILRDILTGSDPGVSLLVVYLQGLIDAQVIAETVYTPLLSDHRLAITRTNAVERLEERLLTNAVLERVETMEDVTAKLLSGRVIIFPDGNRSALACDVSSTPERGISEPETEGLARGPREGFVEALEPNIALLRRRLRTADLRVENFVVGRYTQTRLALVYLKSLAADSIIEEARSRLERIDENIDGIFVSEGVAELIEDHPFSLFPTINATERPERVAASLLEGRFAIFVEGSPFTLMAPTLFAEFFTSSADYTERAFTVAMLRIIRVVTLFSTLFLPSIYVALASFHHETIPTVLLLSIAMGREGVPFPPIVEAILMEAAFEVLREAGLRLPRSLGNAVSIVGVLVVGQAAVSAGIISPILIIVVGATAIASFTIPNFPTANILRVLRFPVLLLTGLFGYLGIIVSFIMITVHLVSLRSFGVPYLSPLAPFRAAEMQKAVIRPPLWLRTPRPQALWPKDRKRESDHLMPRPPKGGEDDGER